MKGEMWVRRNPRIILFNLRNWEAEKEKEKEEEDEEERRRGGGGGGGGGGRKGECEFGKRFLTHSLTLQLHSQYL